MPLANPRVCLLLVCALASHATAQIVVNTSDRNAVVNLYNNVYLPAYNNGNHGWTGSVAGCVPGTVNAQFMADSLTAVNVFRAMAGMNNVTFGDPRNFPTSGSGNVDCQQGALMLHAAGQLSHNLPPTSPCYTAAGNAALATSNLTGGVVGAAGMESLIDDGNGDMGHRRWMLHEPQLQMAMGSTSTYMLLDVMAPMAPGNRSRFSAWPPAGFVPYQWTFTSWTFAVPGVNQDPLNPATHADFSNATVTVTRGGNAVPISVRIPSQCIFCYDNAIAWTFTPPLQVGPGMSDTPYVVTISNIANTAQSTYTYTVTLIDAQGATPTPDECAGATPVNVGVNGPFNNATATTSAPAWPCGSGGKDLWFSFQSGGTGTLTATTCNLANFDTVIEVFSGTCGNLTSLGCNDDACSTQSTVAVPVNPGTYFIRVGGFSGASGNFSLDITGPAGGSNPDECAGATPVNVGVNGPYSNATATTSAPAWPCGSGGKDLWFSFQASGGTLTATTCSLANFDTVIEVFSGTCGNLTSLGCNDDACSTQSTVAVPVSPGTYFIRVGGYNGASGSFSLSITDGVSASSTNYGSGCYLASKAFYELFGTAAAFDLDNTRMRLVRNGNFYVAQAGGSYVAPTPGATVLALGDDATTSVNLTGSFPYIGGTTSSLEVCSNGFVSVAAGNGAPPTPSAAAWLAGVQPRWGTWHDFDPTPAAGGKVKFHQVGSIAYVTWDGVFSYNTSTPNTWQLQFDLTTGDVTYAWQTMAHSGGGVLVGYAAAAPNSDAGSRDICASLPGTFRTSADNLQPLALASNLPVLGSTLALTTTNHPATTTLGAIVESFVQQDPGIDLGPLGMAGCRRYVGLDSILFFAVSGPTAVFNQGIPNLSSLSGVRFLAQSIVLAPGVNPTGVLTSNGVALVVGL